MLRSVRLRNFRSLRDTGEVALRPIVLLVGANSSGKSSFLRFFPLLKQTVGANSNSPLLWYRDNGDVDLGSFSNTLFRAAKEPWIEVSASCDLNGRAPGARSPFRFSSRIASGPDGRSFVERCSVSAGGDTLEFEAAADAALGAIRLNGRELPPVEGRISQHLVGPLAGPQRHALDGLAAHLLGQKILERVAEGSSDDISAKITELIDDGSAEEILHDLSRVNLGGKKWRERVASLAADSGYVREIKELVFMRELGGRYLSELEGAMARFARGVRYLGPFRRPPQRFYRKAELAVDEIDRDGSNLAMFLDSLGSEDVEAFSTWVRRHFGFGVRAERRDPHVALMIDTGAASGFNLMDMGFGMSQLLPVIAQCWLSSGQLLASGQIPLFRDPARSILPGTAPTLIAVEQPELHLHPHHQAQLADMFCNTASAMEQLSHPLTLCVETHSEAMIYRFGELVEEGKLSRGDITILFFEKQAGRDETTVRPIEFDEHGVLQDWPIGFFRG